MTTDIAHDGLTSAPIQKTSTASRLATSIEYRHDRIASNDLPVLIDEEGV